MKITHIFVLKKHQLTCHASCRQTHVINKELGQNNTLYSTAGDPLVKTTINAQNWRNSCFQYINVQLKIYIYLVTRITCMLSTTKIIVSWWVFHLKNVSPCTNFSDKKQLFINDIKCRALRKLAVFSKYFSCDLD